MLIDISNTDKEREQAYKTYKQIKRETLDIALANGSQELDPLESGQRRMYFSRESYLDFLRNGMFESLLDINDISLVMTLGQQFAVTLTPRLANIESVTAVTAAAGKL
jgi:hypothetical protein